MTTTTTHPSDACDFILIVVKKLMTDLPPAQFVHILTVDQICLIPPIAKEINNDKLSSASGTMFTDKASIILKRVTNALQEIIDSNWFLEENYDNSSESNISLCRFYESLRWSMGSHGRQNFGHLT